MKLKVYDSTRERYEHITVEKKDSGWFIKGKGIKGGDCDKGGEPYINRTLLNLIGNCPPMVNIHLQQLWNIIDGTNLNDEEIQERLDEISNLIPPMN